MSRRPAAADRTMQNQQTLKSLVKLEGNKSCADCKRNKHPRWASWNLGIFICIRCSGIHRGMGTHISRVKSVDLDSWTDEQLQSMLKWGNTRANKYWESKLAPGHVPAEAKIENFIRTKYDAKRWTMDGPIPDPSTLGTEGGDDDVPLNVVQEKAKLDRSASLKNASMSSGPAAAPQPPRSVDPVIDLFGDDPTPVRASTAEPTIASRPLPQQQQKASPAPPKQNRPGDSLLGLDFFGTSQSAAPARPASAASGATIPGSNPRSDLKQSILSLYASAPKPAQAQQQQPASNAFGGFSATPIHSPTASISSFGGMADAFGGLNFGSSPAPQQQQQQQPVRPSAFSNLTSPVARTSSLSGGSFFEAKPAPPPKPSAEPALRPQAAHISNGFGGFGDFTSAPAPMPARSPVPASSGMGDLFDMSAPAPSKTTNSTSASAFNLSSPAPPKPSPAPAMSGLDNMDAWGSSNAWSTPEAAAPAPPTTSYKAPPTASVSNDDEFGGWGSNEGNSSTKPTVTQDDEFGGWSSAPAPAASASNKAPAADDLFGNVWG